DQQVSRGKLLDTDESSGWGRYVSQREIPGERVEVGPRALRKRGQKRRHLRGEAEVVVARSEIQRFLSGAIAGQHEALLFAIPDRDREHPAQTAHEVIAVLLVQMDDDLRVRARGEAVTASLELSPQLEVVVDFTIDQSGDRAVLAEHR